jgi:DNA (cytosine-5)-methyltransferase 1
LDKQNLILPNITLGSLFDGIGGFPYAASFFGIKTLWASEIMPQAISVTQRHLPEMEHLGDLTQLRGDKLPPVDIITFGSPCQDLSVAGKRAGLEGERSGLFSEAIRIIDEMRYASHGIYPRYAIWENVPGALSSGNPRGSDFQAVLEAFAKTEVPIPQSGRWANAGMVRSDGADLAWCVYNAQHFGVPQRRRRIFLVCDFGGGCAGEILFIPQSLSGYFAARRAQGQSPAADALRGSDGASLSANIKDTAATLFAGYGNHWNGNAGAYDGGNFALSPTPQCLNPWDTQQSRVFTEEGLSPTLAGADGGGGRNPGGLVYLCEPNLARTLTARGDGSPNIDGGPNIVAVGVHQNQNGDVNTSPTAYTLNTNGNATGRNAPLICENIKAVGLTSKGNGDCFVLPECHYALTCGGGQAGQGYPAALVTHPSIAGTLCASGAGMNRPGGMGSEPDFCIVVPDSETIPINDKATRYKGGGDTRKDDGSGNGLGVGKDGDPAPTLTSGDRHAVAAYCLQGNMIGRQDHNGPMGSGVNGDVSFTLNTVDQHAVAATFCRQRSDLFRQNDVASTQTARQCKDATDVICQKVVAVDCRNLSETEELSGTLQSKPQGYSLNYPVRSGYIVRRLLPVECERLQGYPDGWTEFGHDGSAISDTRRYQMLGNSVAVPCVAYIMLGIAEQFRREAEVV